MRLARGIDRKSALVTFMMGGWVVGELGWLIGMENRRADFDKQTKAEIHISRSIIDRLKKGEKVDVQKELLQKDEPESLEDIMKSLETSDTKWAETAPKIQPSEPPKKGGWI